MEKIVRKRNTFTIFIEKNPPISGPLQFKSAFRGLTENISFSLCPNSQS